jgi:hypothetical protein
VAPLAVGAELSNEVAETAIAVAVALRHFGERAVFQEDGAEGFVTAVQRLGGLAEEGFAEDVVHGSTLRNVTALFRLAF